MSMRVLYASDYFSPKSADEAFAEEAGQLSKKGVNVSVANIDDVEANEPIPPLEVDDEVLYRGWMLDSDGYASLERMILRFGAKPYTDLPGYLSTHHIPNWYPKLEDLTPETVVVPLNVDIEAALGELGWSSFFVKDYVKSLKTSMGSRIDDPKQITQLVVEMEKYRGQVEGGLCVRRVEDFEPDSEVRYFVLQGEPHSPTGEPVPPIVSEVASRIESRFFSVDVARRSDGSLRVVEIGDGQVSDLVGWSVERFVGVLASAA